MYMGIPELWALVLLAFVTVGFVSTRKYVRSALAIVIGVTIGLVGVDVNNVPRFTMGWRYLEDGIQILPYVAGLFAIPELWNGWFEQETDRHYQMQSMAVGRISNKVSRTQSDVGRTVSEEE